MITASSASKISYFFQSMFAVIVICLKYLCSEKLFSNTKGNYSNKEKIKAKFIKSSLDSSFSSCLHFDLIQTIVSDFFFIVISDYGQKYGFG